MRQASGRGVAGVRAVALALALGLAVAAGGGCASFRHGFSQARVEGQVLRATAGPGAERLEIESDFDPSVRTYVADRGLPDYIHVVSSRQVQLVYLERDEIAVFQREGFDPTSRVSVRSPIPEAIVARLPLRERARLETLRRVGAGDEPETPSGAPPTLADTVALCRSIQTSPEVPIACQFTYLEGVPAMFIVFPDLDTATSLWSAVTRHVGTPFCAAANRADRRALFVIALAENELARIFACETQTWSPWFPLRDAGEGI